MRILQVLQREANPLFPKVPFTHGLHPIKSLHNPTEFLTKTRSNPQDEDVYSLRAALHLVVTLTTDREVSRSWCTEDSPSSALHSTTSELSETQSSGARGRQSERHDVCTRVTLVSVLHRGVESPPHTVTSHRPHHFVASAKSKL